MSSSLAILNSRRASNFGAYNTSKFGTTSIFNSLSFDDELACSCRPSIIQKHSRILNRSALYLLLLARAIPLSISQGSISSFKIHFLILDIRDLIYAHSVEYFIFQHIAYSHIQRALLT